MADRQNTSPPVKRGIRPFTCSVCGSAWFREETFLAPQVRLKDPLLVCLCGTVVTPQLSGIRPPSDQDEIDRLSAALANVRNLRQAVAEAAALAEGAVGATATLISKITRLERSCELLRQRLLPISTAVTPSRLPRRAAATNGVDVLVLELQRTGLLDFRQARQVVWTVRDFWKAALLKGEPVETPLGILSARKTPSGRRSFVLKALPVVPE